MDGLLLRRYRAQDHAAVVELHRAALRAVDTLMVGMAIDADLEHPEAMYIDRGGEFLVVERDGRVVGMGAMRRISAQQAEIKRMRVEPALWRRGIGSVILGALEQRARELGFTELILDTAAHTTAVEFYRDAGYTEYGRRQLGRWNLVLMRKSLSC